MAIARLSEEDRFMLWPDQRWPQHIGALAVLDGRRLVDSQGRFRLEDVRDAVAGRLHLVPRFRQLLQVPRLGMGGPLWVDADRFDIRDHVELVQLPSPAGEGELLAAVERLRARRLDHARPLWGMWFLPGLADGRIGLYVKTHHCVADGIAGMASLAAFLDAVPDVQPPPPHEDWTPERAPTAGELRGDSARRHLAAGGRHLAALAHPVETIGRWRDSWPAVRELALETPGTATTLDRFIGPDRVLELVRTDLALMKAIGHAHSAKVNDVLLALIAAGLRALLESRGELRPETMVKIDVPISLRLADRANARGNLISMMVIPLAVGVADGHTRLRLIAAETARRKAAGRPSLGGLPHGHLAAMVMLPLVARQHVNVTSADLPGPEAPLYFAGAEVLELFPLLPLIGNVTLAVGALSYAGQFNVMVAADRDTYPDLGIFTAGLRQELAAFGASSVASAIAAQAMPSRR